MPTDSDVVSKYRAIMTTTDRERVTGEADVEDSKKYQSISRVRERIDELETDAELLEEHHPELYEELQAAICD